MQVNFHRHWPEEKKNNLDDEKSIPNNCHLHAYSTGCGIENNDFRV